VLSGDEVYTARKKPNSKCCKDLRLARQRELGKKNLGGNRGGGFAGRRSQRARVRARRCGSATERWNGADRSGLGTARKSDIVPGRATQTACFAHRISGRWGKARSSSPSPLQECPAVRPGSALAAFEDRSRGSGWGKSSSESAPVTPGADAEQKKCNNLVRLLHFRQCSCAFGASEGKKAVAS
jgi:hypothetical protein